MDCNVSLVGVKDSESGRRSSDGEVAAQENERQRLLVEFVEKHGLMACNTCRIQNIRS